MALRHLKKTQMPATRPLLKRNVRSRTIESSIPGVTNGAPRESLTRRFIPSFDGKSMVFLAIPVIATISSGFFQLPFALQWWKGCCRFLDWLVISRCISTTLGAILSLACESVSLPYLDVVILCIYLIR